MPPADFDALSDGSDLTGEDSASDLQEDDEEVMASAPQTPSKKRRRTTRTIMKDDEEDEYEVADALADDDGDQLDDDDEDADDLDEDDEEYDAPSTSRRGATRNSGRKSARSEAATPKRSARTSTRATAASTTPAASAGKKSLRVKLTRTPQATVKEDASPAPTGRASKTAPSAPTPPATRRAKDASKVKWKPRAKSGKASDSDEDEIPVPDDDELEDELDVSHAPTVLSASDDESSSEPDEATALEMQAIIGKTARQLAREGGAESSHMELPMFDPNRKKKLTENEIALRRSETARKRKNQVEKKLEDDKVETINRLLKKQVGRSRNKLRAGSEDSDEEVEQARKRGKEELSRKALKEMPAPYFRLIDRADGKVLGVPTGPATVEQLLGANYVEVNQTLIAELDKPIQTEELSEKQRSHAQRARKRLEEQAERWKQDHALDHVWGQEGLYEYKLRTVLGQSRQDWIGSRRQPTIEQQQETEEQDAEVEAEAEADEQDDDAEDEVAEDAEGDQDEQDVDES
ncbi:hypothetical protein PHSY_007304 [Pseudozyma hubeiensis SY62]|uniref:INO80 complex subunit B-like conserved region domain-containing protein n=1 Tax=Pseudozyma hubeiensis (strain SY62) TaxID=1305764 RepID=R9PEC1_PSEHS|nr:hypothetical protein PHSY_007304 [Pseudozyma hubeiensis SY62]GAC99701.1 hypothetical protein PHSY_007304 [Pseudozyma hubeiensis SY62]